MEHAGEREALLVKLERPQQIEVVQQVLESAGIPFRSGLLAEPSPAVLFYVPEARLAEARHALADRLRVEAPVETDRPAPQALPPFPWTALGYVAALVTAHLALSVWVTSGAPAGRQALLGGGLRPDLLPQEPWRLLTSLFLHMGPAHAFWNGVSTVVFAVPLLVALGALRTAAIYLLAGIGGGLTATAFADGPTMIVGSSGAVAGLFGAWIVLTLRTPGDETPGWRRRVRTLGVALLFLPSLIDPVTPGGQSVSVSSHLGGLATGLAVGGMLSLWMTWTVTVSPDRNPEAR